MGLCCQSTQPRSRAVPTADYRTQAEVGVFSLPGPTTPAYRCGATLVLT